MSVPDADEIASAAATEGRVIERDLRQTMLSGAAITIPFFITLLVLAWVLNFLSNALSPVASLLVHLGPGEGMSSVLVELLAGAIVIATIFLVGLAARRAPTHGMGSRVDALMSDLPGIGSIYTSVNRMSEVMLESDTESFQEVKLVEFPRDESYALGFLTSEPPAEITSAAGHDEMVTVFVPMAPNPVMGGHLLNLPEERVYDVDMPVEEGMQAIMTTGVAIDESIHDESEAAP
jgi:uncharacterized membrane protein